MKAFLLAAGHGTRLRPITDTLPKCLVPIRGTPLLSIWLSVCKRFEIDEVLINVHAHGNMVQEFLKRNANGTRVRVIEEQQLLGSAGTLRSNRDWVGSDDCFWVFYADVLCRTDLGEMMQLHRHQKARCNAWSVRSTGPQPLRNCLDRRQWHHSAICGEAHNTDRQPGVLWSDDRNAGIARRDSKRHPCRHRVSRAASVDWPDAGIYDP